MRSHPHREEWQGGGAFSKGVGVRSHPHIEEWPGGGAFSKGVEVRSLQILEKDREKLEWVLRNLSTERAPLPMERGWGEVLAPVVRFFKTRIHAP